MSMPAGERRIVSVLVADVAGSTPIAEKLGPERSKYLFDEVVGLMRAEVERFGGTIAQLTGDGVLALFGAPVAHEDDSERAVRAGMAIREAIARYGSEVAPASGFELGARVAVNTGPVVVPARDAPADVLYNALGDTVNVAARLQALGDLVVGPATARQVGASFELDELGELELKGRVERVRAFRLRGVAEEPAAGREAELVGRRSELRTLSDALAAGRAIVSITGEPGIGKSRLVTELEQRFAGSIRFLAGHAVAYAETIPYWPVRELLRAWLGLGASDSEARTRLELRAELSRRLGDGADEAYPFLGTLLGLALDPEQERRVSGLARDAVQQETFYWLYQLVCSLARERALCLVFDDIQWSDESTLALLEELLPAVDQASVSFLLVHRSDPDHPAWQLVDRARRRFRRRFLELELEPLAEADVRELGEAAADGSLADDLAQLLAEQTGGNPYFVSEAIRDLRERGALEQRNGALALVGDASIPAAIQEALQARLDRLDPEARELLTTAAVVGRSFGLPLLERLLPRARLVPTLSELQWLQLVVEERGGATPEYRFRHGLVQEAAYATLVETRRRELHLQVGEALEDFHRDSPAEVYGLLGHHFAEGDEPGRAVEYLLKAADAARAVYAEDEAIALYRQALGFMERAGDELQARETLLRLGLTHHVAFDFHAASEAFSSAFARPGPAPVRFEPTEKITFATGAPWSSEPLAPGLTPSDLANWTILNLFRGLVAVGRDFDIRPDLAEQFTISDDGLTYRFTLRSDARWSDGTRVTADDFAFTFARIAGSEACSAPWLAGVTPSALDDRTLQIELEEPRNHLLYQLGDPSLFAWPRHVVEQRGPEWHKDVPLVGSGPFVLTGRRPPADEETGWLRLECSPTWSGPRGNVAEVTIEQEPSLAAARERWRAGGYDLFYDALATFVGLLPDDQTIMDRAPGGFTDYLGFGSRPPLDDSRVRRAIAHAIDRETLPRGASEISAGTGGLLPPAIPGHSPRVAPAFDTEAAAGLLREAGYPGGRGLEEIELAHFGIEQEIASVVAAQLRCVGVRVRLRPTASVAEKMAAVREPVHLYIWAYGYAFPDPIGGFLEPALRENTGLYRDEEVEQLLARAAGARDQDERLRLAREVERIWIGEQAAVVPLAYSDRVIWRRPWVTGMWANAIAKSTFAEAVVNPGLRSGPRST
jgi:ABC-type transport system substrate-binding protein/class 3 adenylate cyclase